MDRLIGIDIGGSHVTVGIVSLSGQVLSARTEPLPPQAPVGVVVDVIRRLAQVLDPGGEIAVAGVGVASTVDLAGRVRFAPNLGWRDAPLGDMLSEALPARVFVYNDADAACFAEARVGAASGARHAVMLTLGTGIGGGIVVDGKLYRGAGGFAAEIGHMKIVAGGPLCGCGGRGCLEALAAGPAIRARAEHLLAAHPDLAAQSPLRSDRSITVKAIFDAARAGDVLAGMVVEETATYLGLGVANIINILDPQVIVLGGSIARAGDVLLNPVRAFAAGSTMGGPRPYVRIVTAALGPEAGFVGAALLAGAEPAR